MNNKSLFASFSSEKEDACYRVFVSEMRERSKPGFTRHGTITDAHCSIRARFGHIAPHQSSWWSLGDDPKLLTEKIGSLIIEVTDGDLNLTRVARLDTAMILLRRGERDEPGPRSKAK